MSNVIDFKPVSEMNISVDLDDITLEDVFEALYSRYDMNNITICWEEEDGQKKMASEDYMNSVMLLENLIDEI